MQKIIALISLLLIGNAAFSQTGDFIVIKKNNQTVKTFFTGSNARFKTISGQWFDGNIIDIRNDSLFFREVIVQQVPTPWGVPRLDTMTTFVRRIYYKDIIAIPKRSESFTYIKNGVLLMVLGGGYAGLNIINSGYQHYAPFGKDNLPNLLTAAGVFGVGKLMQKRHKPYVQIGGKYSMRYIKG